MQRPQTRGLQAVQPRLQELSAYGLGAEQIQRMGQRFAEWRTELLRQPGPTVA